MVAVAFLVIASSVSANNPKKTLEDLISRAKAVYIVNPEPIKVEVVEEEESGSLGVQKWEHWYQCHPNPADEAEIRGYINDRGQDGWEVVSAAAINGTICEYYKRPLVE